MSITLTHPAAGTITVRVAEHSTGGWAVYTDTAAATIVSRWQLDWYDAVTDLDEIVADALAGGWSTTR